MILSHIIWVFPWIWCSICFLECSFSLSPELFFVPMGTNESLLKVTKFLSPLLKGWKEKYLVRNTDKLDSTSNLNLLPSTDRPTP